MTEELGYLSQDFSWNAQDGRFPLTLHSDIFPLELLSALNQSAQYEYYGKTVIAILSVPQISALFHCECKQGEPAHNLDMSLESTAEIVLIWPGVTRIFARVRIMKATTAEELKHMVIDDIESRHGTSDVELLESNQSFRPWSDEEDSETDTA
jgi:hypothetical protein